MGCNHNGEIIRGQKIGEFICHTKCDTFDTAQELEKQLHAQGYDTGDKVGNGQENSIYVYMYRKIKGVTIE